MLTRSALLCAIFLFSIPANAEVTFGERTTENGTFISVEEDFMNEKYPRHVIALSSTEMGDSDGRLIFRCNQNKTEVYFASGSFDFFGHGRKPQLSYRFPSDEEAIDAKASASSDGEAAFIPNAIEFMARTVEDGSVGLSGNYYSGSFRQNFILDDETTRALYELADTCEWLDRLPERNSLIAETNEMINPLLEAKKELTLLVEKYGLDEIRHILSDF